jgi:hypothetical protein
MKTWLRKIWHRKPRPRRERRTTNLGVECLEGRLVPAVTFHGGALLSNVEVQAVYLGGDWNQPGLQVQKSQFESCLQNLVQGSYMQMLSDAGYNVGLGTFDAGVTIQPQIDKTQFLFDTAIRNDLELNICSGTLKQPDSNRLYVVFVEPDVAVWNDHYQNQNSMRDFLGYHQAFAGTDAAGRPADIRYAVVDFPRGNISISIPFPWGGTTLNGTNASFSWLTNFDGMTLTASHELAEAVTDPDVGYKTLGWYDAGYTYGEIGDLANAQTVFLNNFAVQRIVDQKDNPMTPRGAGSVRSANFVRLSNGQLEEISGVMTTVVSNNVVSVSNQGIDNFGRAMVDFVDNSGNAFEFHDGGSKVFLRNNVIQACAGQGVSYVLGKDLGINKVYEFNDATGRWGNGFFPGGDGARSIDAGTDKYGVNAVAVIANDGRGSTFLHSDSDGWHFIAYTAQVSCGPQGLVAYVSGDGNAWWYTESSNHSNWIMSNVRQVTTGCDTGGHWLIGVVTTKGNAYRYSPDSNTLAFLADGVLQMSDFRLGMVDFVFGGTDARFLDQHGMHLLVNNGAQVAV